MRFLFDAVLTAVLLAAASVGCAPKQPPVTAASPAPPAPSGPSARVVNATILTNECQKLGKGSAQVAERTMNDLVEGCTAVPGGSARFEATLQPGGRIEITAAPGEPGTVPICVLKHALVHHVPLAKPCRLDVRMEETRLAVPSGEKPGSP